MKRFLSLLMAVLLTVAICGCGNQTTATNSSGGDKTSSTSSTSNGFTMPEPQKSSDAYADKAYGFQTEAPKTGEKVVVLSTNHGDIYIRLFPEAAPKACENFIKLAESGYYDGITFHRIIENFMMQGGDPNGTGTGGQSYWGTNFEDEFDKKMVNIDYSVAMANSGKNTNGSQFFINHTNGKFDKTAFDQIPTYEDLKSQISAVYNQYVTYYGNEFKKEYPTANDFLPVYAEQYFAQTPLKDSIPTEIYDLYKSHGGNLHLDGAWRASGGHTVFGYVYKGKDVVDNIMKVETDSNDKPTTSVVINKAYTETVK